MSTVIQNLACFPVRINPDTKRVYFDEDLLQGKKINSIWIYFGDEDYQVNSPFSPELQVINDSDFEELMLLFNLVDVDSLVTTANLSFDLIKRQTDDAFYRGGVSSFQNLVLDCVLDIQKSFVSVYCKNEINFTGEFLMFVSYETAIQKITTSQINGCVSVDIPANLLNNYDLKLSDIINNVLRGKKIKRITNHTISTYFDQNPAPGYLYLKCKNNLIENIPLTWLNDNSPKELFFDEIEIDFEESFFKCRGTNKKSVLTFYY